MERLPLKIDDKRLAVNYLEEHFEVVKLDLFGEIRHRYIHLVSRSQRASPWLNLEDTLLEDMAFEGLFLGWLSWIRPGLHLNFVVVWHLESPFSWDPANIL